MNQEEKTIIDGIFERIKPSANQPRDPETEHYIVSLLQQQPYAPYIFAQSLYVQEQALLQQQKEIEQLRAQIAQMEKEKAEQPKGFLSGLFGGGSNNTSTNSNASAPASTPSFIPSSQSGNRVAADPSQAQQYNNYRPQSHRFQSPSQGPWGGSPQSFAPAAGGGMGFLGTAAATAAGMAGGMMLGNMLSNAFGGGHHDQLSSLHQSSASNNEKPTENAQNISNQEEFNGNSVDEASYDNSFDDYGSDNDSYDV